MDIWIVWNAFYQFSSFDVSEEDIIHSKSIHIKLCVKVLY